MWAVLLFSALTFVLGMLAGSGHQKDAECAAQLCPSGDHARRLNGVCVCITEARKKGTVP